MSARKRSNIGSNTIQITSSNPRSRMSVGGGSSSMTIRRSVGGNVLRSSMAYPQHAKGELQAKTKNVVGAVVDGKNKEKAEMVSLNTKLASMLQDRLFSLNQASMLQDQVDRLKKEKTPDTSEIRDEYLGEMEDLRDAVNKLKSQIATYEPARVELQEKIDKRDGKISLLEKQNKELEAIIERLNEKCSEMESELKQLQGTLDIIGTKLNHKDEDIERLEGLLEAAENDLRDARTEQIESSHALCEERARAEFEEDAAGKEIEILKQEVQAMKNCQPKFNQAELKNSFQAAVQQLSDKYEQDMAVNMDRMQKRYDSQLMKFENAAAQKRPDVTDSVTARENKTLKSQMNGQMGDMNNARRDLEEMRRRYQELQDEHEAQCIDCEEDKQRLQNEIDSLNSELEDTNNEMEIMEKESFSMAGEIQTYKLLLDGKGASLSTAIQQSENMQSRSGAMMANLISQGGGSGNSSSGGGHASQNSS